MSDVQGQPPSTTPHAPSSADLPHRPADDSEEVYYDGSPLMRGAIRRNVQIVLAGILLILLPLLIRFVFHHHVNSKVFAILIVLGLILASIPPLWALTIRFRVTNYRIDYERGLFSKDIDTLELWHVEDIAYKQEVIDRILGIGTIQIIAHDRTTPKLEMHSLPNSRHLFDQLKQRIIAVKRQRGVMKLDTGT